MARNDINAQALDRDLRDLYHRKQCIETAIRHLEEFEDLRRKRLAAYGNPEPETLRVA